MAVAQLIPEFEKRGTKVLGVSVDSVEDHGKWKHDIEKVAGAPANFAIIDDRDLTVAKAYDMLPADYYLPTEGRTPAHSATVRTVFIIGPDKKVRLTMTYPMSVGRNFPEIMRALAAVQQGCYSGTADLLVYFIQRGIDLLNPGEAFAYITSNKWYRAKYGANLRAWLNRNV